MPVRRKNRGARNTSDNPEEFRATLVEHLEELRDRIMRALAILTVAWIIGWFLEPWVFTQLEAASMVAIRKNLPPDTKVVIIFLHAIDAFMLKLKLSFIIGLVMALPFVVIQLWKFVEPGLKPNERKPFRTVAPMAILLFAMGAYFCWLIIPPAMTWFTGYLADFKGTELHQEAGKLTTFALKMMLAFGMAFQLPLVVYILGKVGLLSPDTLMKYWRQSLVAVFFASALLTPSNDPLSMLMMAIPLSILFIISVYAVRATSKAKVVEELDDLD